MILCVVVGRIAPFNALSMVYLSRISVLVGAAFSCLVVKHYWQCCSIHCGYRYFTLYRAQTACAAAYPGPPLSNLNSKTPRHLLISHPALSELRFFVLNCSCGVRLDLHPHKAFAVLVWIPVQGATR